MNLPRSTYYHKSKIETDDQDLIAEIEAIIEEYLRLRIPPGDPGTAPPGKTG